MERCAQTTCFLYQGYVRKPECPWGSPALSSTPTWHCLGTASLCLATIKDSLWGLGLAPRPTCQGKASVLLPPLWGINLGTTMLGAPAYAGNVLVLSTVQGAQMPL